MTDVRVGQGFDAHRFHPGRPLVLCGVRFAGEIGLDGHSDADVCLHAVTDAILGAVAGGDMGEHFPSTDPHWRESPSSAFVVRALELAADEGFSLVNCDLTIVGEQPRIAAHREELRGSLAEVLGIPRSAASVKATTTEGMGFVGRAEGLAALAVVLLERSSRDA